MPGIFALIAAGVWYVYYRRWRVLIRDHWRPLPGVLVPLLALAIIGEWGLISPLFTNVIVEEEFPFAFDAVVPLDMTKTEVKEVMASMAKVN